jgi:hypothetical protein
VLKLNYFSLLFVTEYKKKWMEMRVNWIVYQLSSDTVHLIEKRLKSKSVVCNDRIL